MASLEHLTAGTRVRGLIPDGEVTILAANWIGSNVVDAAYRDHAGRTGSQLLHRDHEPSLLVEDAGDAWPFDADAALFKLAAEGRRIHLANLFDPHLAVHTSLVDPLPHQITVSQTDRVRGLYDFSVPVRVWMLNSIPKVNSCLIDGEWK